MIYRNVLSAVVSVLAAECIDNTSKQSWQRLVGDDVRPTGSGMSANDRALLDCWTHARLHAQLSPRHWNVFAMDYRNGRHYSIWCKSNDVKEVMHHDRKDEILQHFRTEN